MTIFRFSAALAAISVLLGCSGSKPNPFICDDPPGFLAHAYDADGEQRVAHECLEKWGYRLARASGSNREIADATIGACREALVQLRFLRQKEKFKASEKYTEEAWLKDEADLREAALFRVVQARAGNCPDRADGQK